MRKLMIISSFSRRHLGASAARCDPFPDAGLHQGVTAVYRRRVAGSRVASWGRHVQIAVRCRACGSVECAVWKANFVGRFNRGLCSHGRSTFKKPSTSRCQNGEEVVADLATATSTSLSICKSRYTISSGDRQSGRGTRRYFIGEREFLNLFVLVLASR